MIANNIHFKAKYLKLFHEEFRKSFLWEVPGTEINGECLKIPVNELPVKIEYDLTCIRVCGGLLG